jgi:hypothetical protein
LKFLLMLRFLESNPKTRPLYLYLFCGPRVLWTFSDYVMALVYLVVAHKGNFYLESGYHVKNSQLEPIETTLGPITFPVEPTPSPQQCFDTMLPFGHRICC